jgi:transcriptional regulator with XRE-family HTH domain
MENRLGELLAQLRRKKRLRQKQVAGDAGVDKSYLAELESGRKAAPSPSVLGRLVKALGATDADRLRISRAVRLLAIERAATSGNDPLPDANLLVRLGERLPHMSEDDKFVLGWVLDALGRGTNQEEENAM